LLGGRLSTKASPRLTDQEQCVGGFWAETVLLRACQVKWNRGAKFLWFSWIGERGKGKGGQTPQKESCPLGVHCGRWRRRIQLSNDCCASPFGADSNWLSFSSQRDTHSLCYAAKGEEVAC